MIHTRFGANVHHQLTSLDEVATSASQLIHGKPNKAINCINHEKPVKIFCETCQELICRDCTVRIHKDHECHKIADSYHKHRQKLEMKFNSVKEMFSHVFSSLTALTKRENEIKEQGDMVKQEIHVIAEEMIEKIRQSERQLTRKVETEVDSKLQVLSGQKKSAEMSLTRLKGCKEFVEQSLKTGSHQQVLMSKKQMMECMSHVTKEINVEEYNLVVEKMNVHFIKNDQTNLNVGEIVLSSSQKCSFKKEIQHEKKVSLPPCTVQLPPVSCSAVPSLSYTAVIITEYPDNPLESVNDPHQLLDSTPVHMFATRIIRGLGRPFGVAVTEDGLVIVTECKGHRITVLYKNGNNLKKVRSIASMRTISSSKSIYTLASSNNVKSKFTSPRGVAITPDKFILVTDQFNIQKLNLDGKLVASISCRQLGLDCPTGIAVSPKTGHIYIADSGNHCIQVLDPNLNFSYSFGGGTCSLNKGRFMYPEFIAIDHRGLVYISDTGNHRVQVFTLEGKYKFQIGRHGFDHGQLKCPTGLAINNNNNLLYVVERGNHRVSVFTTDGQFVGNFGGYGRKKYRLNCPCGIAFDSEGCFYICDFDNNRLVMCI